ncbi:hypothetical protein [Mucilaginibacter terrae]|uniref:Addiction module protein n=1 Tax=Mucilaginibacter terrae TaxID=1955052 RepID=A0ABU3GY42_9SPHI|nr:hypothetical protein [Mucilaginibacter terrae]MDT3404346.1 hypothetical protein [Mucilaginibacter terrae]
MTATVIREKLYDYIKVTDDKKLAAIYNLLEEQIVEYTDWHNDEAFVAELDEHVKNWEVNPAQGSSMDEVKMHIQSLREKRK